MDEKIFSKFKSVLAQSLMLDHAELDFGIYRIMNQKREQILRFLDNDLPRLVEKTLNEGIDPSSAKELRERLSQATDTEEMEGHVYDHLAHFLARYYDNGDFMPIRRYRSGDTYAIPYDGEEVKLYWANADQYYIKTAEYFRHYAFNTPDGKRVEFTLREATTEQNNNKEEKGKERRFRLAEENPVEMQGDTLHIYFTYEPLPKATKQKALVAEAFEKLTNSLPSEYSCLLAPYKDGADRSLLEKHLTDYVAKNSFDYFIHKDLKGFLSRELDFYVKNEMLVIDDIDSRDSRQFLGVLAEVKAVKVIGGRIIDFLAQIENFQKRLWLKRKFVTQADYCITLDRIPRELYAEICANDRQREEWVRLFAIDEIQGDLLNAGYSEPLSEAFLEANPYLVLDTALFPLDFKHRLLTAISHIDEQCNGLLINSENFQALRLMEEKYAGVIGAVITDPPYNTGDDEFLYKDNYLHSSWMTMMNDRVRILYDFLKDNSWCSININDIELFNLMELMNNFNWSSSINLTVKMSHLSGMKMSHIDKKIPKIKESILIFSKGQDYYINPLYEECDWDEAYERYTSWVDFNNSEIPEEWTKRSVREVALEQGVDISNKEEYDLFRIQNANHIYQRAKNDAYRTYPQDDLFHRDVSARGTTKYILNAKEVLFASNYLKDIKGDGIKIPCLPKGDIWTDIGINNAHNEGGVQLKNGKKPLKLYERLIYILSSTTDIILDPFAGSATTAHACIEQNKRGGTRKYILMQDGFNYFDDKTKRRVMNVIYSSEWKEDKPVSREGISHCFKYLRLEQYEDTLNNLELPKETDDDGLFAGQFRTDYTLGYMLDTETGDSLLNMQWFDHPFDVKMKITQGTETTVQTVDLVETFNYLIGLEVDTMEWPEEGLCIVQGSMRQGGKTAVVWRDKDKVSDDSLKALLTGRKWDVKRIFLNGDSAVIAALRNSLAAKVMNTEEEFKQRMFDEKD